MRELPAIEVIDKGFYLFRRREDKNTSEPGELNTNAHVTGYPERRHSLEPNG